MRLFYSDEKVSAYSFIEDDLVDLNAPNQVPVNYWCNACGELHCHGRFDITFSELPEPLKVAYHELWSENYGQLCYLVDTVDGFGIALVLEYDSEFAESIGYSEHEVFEKLVERAKTLSKTKEFEHAKFFILENGGFDSCHDFIVVFPALTPYDEFTVASKALDKLEDKDLGTKKKKHFRVPVVWEMYGNVYVDAYDEQEAMDIAVGPDTPLPDGDYLDDSIRVDDIDDFVEETE